MKATIIIELKRNPLYFSNTSVTSHFRTGLTDYTIVISSTCIMMTTVSILIHLLSKLLFTAPYNILHFNNFPRTGRSLVILVFLFLSGMTKCYH